MSIPKSSPRPARPRKTPAPPATPEPVSPPPFALATGLSLPALLRQFQSLFPKRSLALWLGDRVFYDRGFTPLIILWYLVFECLSGQSTLEDVVEDARDGGADRLSTKGKPPLSQTLRSDSTASWSDARGRLPVAVVQQALSFSGDTIRATVHNRLWHGMEPMLLDGTTFRLRPWGDIPEQFPPHGGGNNRAPYWCLARSVVAFCLATGVVVDCAVGPTRRSEQALRNPLKKRRNKCLDLWASSGVELEKLHDAAHHVLKTRIAFPEALEARRFMALAMDVSSQARDEDQGFSEGKFFFF